MAAVTHSSAADIMIWLGTVTTLKGESNVEQWYCDFRQVADIIDPDIWGIMLHICLRPKGPIAELEADPLALKAGDEYGKKWEDTHYNMMNDWELWRITKHRERYRRWVRNQAIARHALTITIDPSLRHLIDHVPLPEEALVVLMKAFRGGFKHECSYFYSDYFASTVGEPDRDEDMSDDEESDSDSSDEDESTAEQSTSDGTTTNPQCDQSNAIENCNSMADKDQSDDDDYLDLSEIKSADVCLPHKCPMKPP
ncbi:hypothetical protein N7493_005895 [Penicillium malachiteum]|uniref:Uncharacterized protein n=1 Tax=Penicillium malachiteum TaxID=1324776 RepID=A0AAD6MVV3_9EURO|nr:hypothetical protein N7493_005895 [Penicillium malachiteum]